MKYVSLLCAVALAVGCWLRAGAPPAASVEPGPRAPPRADLVARIEAGFPCPVGVADALAIRIHNQGAPTRGRSW